MTRNRTSALAAILVAALGMGVARDAGACGVCHGDKIAIVYDHATVKKAEKEGKAVVFADITGDFAKSGADGIAFVKRSIAAVSGVDAETVKVSANPVAVAFVFDPKNGTSMEYLDKANLSLAGRKWTLVHLQTLPAKR